MHQLGHDQGSMRVYGGTFFSNVLVVENFLWVKEEGRYSMAQISLRLAREGVMSSRGILFWAKCTRRLKVFVADKYESS